VSGLKHANLHHVHAALTVSKVVCGSIKLGCGLGSHSSPSSLPPPCDQHTTLRCLPFTPLTFLTWLRPGVTAVMVLTSTGRLLLLYISKTSRDFTAFLRNVFEGGSLLLYVPKMSPYFCYFSLRNYNFGNTVGQYQEF